MHLNSCRWQIHLVNHCFLPLLFSLGGFHRPPGLQTVKKRTCITFFSWRNKKKNTYVLQKKAVMFRHPYSSHCHPKMQEQRMCEAQMLFFWNRILPTPGFRLVGKRRNAPAAANPVRKQTKWTNSCLYAQSTRLQPCGASGMSALSMLPCEDCKTYHLKKNKNKRKKKTKPVFFSPGSKLVVFCVRGRKKYSLCVEACSNTVRDVFN